MRRRRDGTEQQWNGGIVHAKRMLLLKIFFFIWTPRLDFKIYVRQHFDGKVKYNAAILFMHEDEMRLRNLVRAKYRVFQQGNKGAIYIVKLTN